MYNGYCRGEDFYVWVDWNLANIAEEPTDLSFDEIVLDLENKSYRESTSEEDPKKLVYLSLRILHDYMYEFIQNVGIEEFMNEEGISYAIDYINQQLNPSLPVFLNGEMTQGGFMMVFHVTFSKDYDNWSGGYEYSEELECRGIIGHNITLKYENELQG